MMKAGKKLMKEVLSDASWLAVRIQLKNYVCRFLGESTSL